ncbi:hypothetical protein ZIOFF_036995 [Zingiber officinale]|uniref:Wbp11/ELF5/Saf1 N-terminal domain-containing protein n=1 Tax=Zingiber officinale TaxID=94328 RepID=A0A8J5GI11_ZINOF|nr:hypothetical protein ZIOFF_036995 [Zingiber officinale]
MAEEKESTSIPLSQAADPEDPAKAPPISPSSSTRKVGLDTHSIATPPSQDTESRAMGVYNLPVDSVVLFPVAVTFYITWWFIQFVDGLLLTLFYILDVSGRMFVGSRYCSENNKCVIHFSTCEVYGKTIGSFLPNDHPLRKNKKERKKVREVGILKKDPEAIREQIEKMERMIYKSQVLQS